MGTDVLDGRDRKIVDEQLISEQAATEVAHTEVAEHTLGVCMVVGCT